MIWLYSGFYARGVDENVLQSDVQVSVTENEQGIMFSPSALKAPIGMLFFHGGGVEPIAYAPLIRGVAEEGYFSVIVKLPYRFAPFEGHRNEAINRAIKIMAQNPDVHTWVVAGHSKGGKIAAELVRDNRSSVDALVLLGTTHPRDFSLASLEIPVKKIQASLDGIATVEKSVATKGNLPQHTQWIEIEGGNHSQFGYYGHQFLDGSATIGRTEQQRRTLEEILATIEGLQR